MTAMLDHAGMIEAGEKTIADRDAEIETLKHKAQGLHRVADKLAVTVEGLEAELADVRMKHEASRKRASDLEAKRVATVNGLQVEFTGHVLQLEVMLARIQQNFEDHSHSLAGSMAGKEAEMATMRKLAEADQRQASLSGECWACD